MFALDEMMQPAEQQQLRAGGVAPEVASHFLTQRVFCFFAEDVGLLPGRLFERLVGVPSAAERLRPQLEKLFEAMCDGGLFGVDDVPWFRFHVRWALAMGSMLEDRPGYNTQVCFLSFPFPAGLTPADTAHQRTEAIDGGALVPADLSATVRPQAEAVARAAQRLVALHGAWLNPPEWTERVPEVTPLGMSTSPYPDRIVARPGFEAELAKRTLTNLYIQRPAWLAHAHDTLDAAVAAAYFWSDWTAAMPDEDILRRLLALNRERAATPG